MKNKVMTNKKYPHLGGNSDSDDTFYPKLYNHIIETFSPKTIIDIGCGRGRTSRYFFEKGIQVTSLDGLQENIDFLNDTNIKTFLFDLTKDKMSIESIFDIGWCCELLEHIEEKYLDNVFNIFKKCNTVFMTHALPGQGGYHHVNCREPKYWIKLFIDNNFILDEDKTNKCRILSHSYFQKTGMVFRNNK
jgi:2-polyprenyl-3-methyl-5-hydroxy-6-metoxy-1,4-benzoquinol methylase